MNSGTPTMMVITTRPGARNHQPRVNRARVLATAATYLDCLCRERPLPP